MITFQPKTTVRASEPPVILSNIVEFELYRGGNEDHYLFTTVEE